MAMLPADVRAILEAMWQHLYAEVEALVRREVPKQFGQMFRGGKIDGTHVTIAYPATGSPAGAAPANAGKLGAVYPDNSTILITADGELYTTLASVIGGGGGSGGGTSTTVTFVSAPAAEKTLFLGVYGSYASDPAGWTLPSFSDAGWSSSTDDTFDQTTFGAGASIPGTIWIAAPETNNHLGGTHSEGSEEWLMRRTFTLPGGVPTAGTVQIVVDAEVLEADINGTALSGATSCSYTAVTTLTIPPSALIGGGANVFAVKIRNGSVTGMSNLGDSAIRYKISATTTTIGGGISGLDVQHNGTDVGTEPILDFEDPAFTVTDDSANTRVKVSLATFGASGGGHKAGIAPDPGSTAGSSRYLCEDGTWSSPTTTDSILEDGTGNWIVDDVSGNYLASA